MLPLLVLGGATLSLLGWAVSAELRAHHAELRAAQAAHEREELSVALRGLHGELRALHALRTSDELAAGLRDLHAAHEREELRRCATAALLHVHGLAVEADAGIRAYHGALPQMFALSASPAAERLRLAASAVSSAAELSARVAELLGDHDGRVTKPDRS